VLISFGSREKKYPLFVIPSTYFLLALLFPDRWNYCGGIALAVILYLGCYGLGKQLSFLVFKTADQSLYMPFGLGVCLAVLTLLFHFSLRPLYLYVIWIGLAGFSILEIPVLTYRVSRMYFLTAPFVLLAFWSSFTPPVYFDTLSNSLGLAHQYLALKKMSVLPSQLFSTFPPFSHSLNILFSGIGFEAGIKSFYIAIYLHLVFAFTSLLRWLITEPVIGGGNGRDKQYQTDLLALVKTELLAIPMLLFAGAWLLIHALMPDLLTAVFFCAGVSAIVKEFDLLSPRKLFNAGLLLSFAMWTQYAALLYVLLTPVLWLSLSHWRLSRESWKQLGTCIGLSLLLWLPFLIRNFIASGDPFYPALSGILPDLGWTPQQTSQLEREIMGSTPGGFGEILLAPLRITFAPQVYGFGAEIGIVPLVSLVLYPLVRKLRVVNQIAIYVLFCYVAWLALFSAFHYFLAPFLYLSLVSYFSFRYLYLRAPKYLYAAWGVCAAVSLFFVIRGYTQYFPFISFKETQSDYLTENLDYYRLAVQASHNRSKKTLLLGESRIAYYSRPVMASGVYDQLPIQTEIMESKTVPELVRRLQARGIEYIVYNEREFAARYGPQGIFPLPAEKISLVREMIVGSTSLSESGRTSLYKIEDRDAW
jgi:hypothetical protein